jgi:hypothetical protein
VGVFFIDTNDGHVATLNQLVEAGLADGRTPPPRPWLRIQGSGDASTMWYAVLRKRERGIYLGALALRHQPHYEHLLGEGWEEVPIDEIGVGVVNGGRTKPDG